MPHIALIDDDQDLTELFTFHLRKNKWKVSVFKTGVSFLAELDQHPERQNHTLFFYFRAQG